MLKIKQKKAMLKMSGSQENVMDEISGFVWAEKKSFILEKQTWNKQTYSPFKGTSIYGLRREKWSLATLLKICTPNIN